MYIIILFVLLAVIGYFMINAARYGSIIDKELPLFAILCVVLAGYIILLIFRLS